MRCKEKVTMTQLTKQYTSQKKKGRMEGNVWGPFGKKKDLTGGGGLLGKKGLGREIKGLVVEPRNAAQLC